MLHVEPKDIEIKTVFGYLLGGIGPRPIALASTIDKGGNINLSPFSFFNAFGANPPTIGFSPSRRLRDNTTKDTYSNLLATKECVISAVTHAMVQQVSLASTEYPSNVNEFEKSGLTTVPSDIVAPPRVKESPFQMECRLVQMIELGGKHASGNLALCEVVKFHIAEELFVDGVIHPDKIDLVARMGADFYCRASGEAVFEVKKPIGRTGIGYDKLPEYIRKSTVLSANNLAQLGNCESIPDSETIQSVISKLPATEPDYPAFETFESESDCMGMLAQAVSLTKSNSAGDKIFERTAKTALDSGNTDIAWTALLFGHSEDQKR